MGNEQDARNLATIFFSFTITLCFIGYLFIFKESVNTELGIGLSSSNYLYFTNNYTISEEWLRLLLKVLLAILIIIFGISTIYFFLVYRDLKFRS